MNLFSKPHEKGKTINFSRQLKIMKALNALANRKPGQTVFLKLNKAPLNKTNLKKRATLSK